jgi:hypothetical protein
VSVTYTQKITSRSLPCFGRMADLYLNLNVNGDNDKIMLKE